ncbi:MAG TPA: protein kinase [Xanthobacteraceae bacterium]|nr:protein kinase [Xanthobacteraceae bacterium]
MTMVGQYEIRELLGSGGIGQVHAAFDTVLEREVAIKSLRPELLNDKSFVDRFRGEATSLAKLNHPNITTLYSLLPEGGNLYLVMECVRGETLEELLKNRGGKLGVRESLAIVAQVADGLAYAHSMGIVHRDIKPANLMITTSGTVKIMDFGIARVRGSQRLTRDGGALGTLAYMSPEQVRGEEADGRSDLYSLAIVLYEMLSGAVPFQADTDYDLMQAHIKTRAPRLSSKVPGIDGALEAALMRGLAKSPDQRFATVREFSDALGATVLRTDASKIVHDGTRLIDVPPPELLRPPQTPLVRLLESSATALAPLLDRLTFIRPDLRLPTVLGAGGVAVVVLAIGIVVLLTPIPAPSSSLSASADTPAPGSLKNGAANRSSPPIAALPQSPNSRSRNPDLVAPGAAGAPRGPGDLRDRSNPTPTPAVAPLPSSQQPPLAPPDASHGTPVAPSPPPGDTSGPTVPGKKEMLAAQRRKDYGAAFEIAKSLARNNNDPDAEYLLGLIFEYGLNGEKDETQARQFYQQAAEQGNASAAFNLARQYEAGIGGEKSIEEAFRWYKKAAEEGDLDAQNSLGYFYLAGKGTDRSDTDAVYWFRSAAEKGFAKAQKNLADMYYQGRGVPQADKAEAFKWYKRAADQNDAAAEYAVASYYEYGLPPKQRDYDAAADWYRKAAAHGSKLAQAALDALQSKGLAKEQ